MRTVKINVFKEQKKWLTWHQAAGATLVVNTQGEEVEARYESPLRQWRGLIGPDGTVEVPDMAYYNSLTSPLDIKEAIDELTNLP
jgi:hypothetical protein